MQLTRHSLNRIERIIERNGKKFVAVFAIVTENNTYKAKLVSLVPFVEHEVIKNKILFLSVPSTVCSNEFYFVKSNKIVSPFSNLDFFVSQPTRAPNF